MDKCLILLTILCYCTLIYCNPIEVLSNSDGIPRNLNYKHYTNARNLRLKNEGNNIKIEPIRAIKPCALHHGDCTEEALEVVYRLEHRRRFGEDAEFNKSDLDDSANIDFIF